VEKILFLVKNPGECLRIGEAARESIKAKFNIEQTIDRLEALYREVARQKNLSENKKDGAYAKRYK